MQGVLHDSKPLAGPLLLLLGLVKSLNVVKVVTLLVEVDGPALQIGVQFKHNQAKAKTGSREHT